jgi:hypothetical protein
VLFPSKGSGAQEGTWRETILEKYGRLQLYTYVDYQAKNALYEQKISNKEIPRLWFPKDASESFMVGHMGQRKVIDPEKKAKKWKEVAQDHYGDCTKLNLVCWWIMKKYVQ